MKTLAHSRDREALRRRLRALGPESPRAWGRMSVQQMVCHLADAFRMALGQRAVTAERGVLPRTMLKWIVLYAPMHWPSGIRTSPEIDQCLGGTTPAGFAADVAVVLELMERTAAESHALTGLRHPVLGRMSEGQWLRWAYLHMDHHLRQFGA